MCFLSFLAFVGLLELYYYSDLFLKEKPGKSCIVLAESSGCSAADAEETKRELIQLRVVLQ